MFQKFSPEYVLSWWIMLHGSHNQCIWSWFWIFSHHFSYFLSQFLNVYYLSVLFNVPGVHLTAWPRQNREQDCVPIIIAVNCGHSSKGGSPAAQTVPLSAQHSTLKTGMWDIYCVIFDDHKTAFQILSTYFHFPSWCFSPMRWEV